MADVVMPRLSDTMEEGTVSHWLKQPGDEVAVGDIIAEIETDKATMELEAYDSGILQQILVPEGETVPIGQTIAVIGAGAVEASPALAPAGSASTPAPASAAPARSVDTPPAPAGAGA